MNPLPRIYTASRTKHAYRWRYLRSTGANIIATWIDEAGEGESPDLADLASRCVREAAECDAVILYVEPDDHIKGALIEVGAALAHGKPVYCVGTCPSISPTFERHPLWRTASSIEEAKNHIAKWIKAAPTGDISGIIGKWPGDETDEQIAAALTGGR